ncbi:sensor protein ZraS [Methyloglobulus morosus KoM1]|uniref:histidine kinase n=1 Tax=Methyloglobulus morosus KoM1 TaxID=1116472 RepID=V5BIH9_9GAMM|nr:ATP-binding protein [Methyloglobulus morosus]ESS73095.1 sensor protein ZraS [Methyloglobulus morosus KoM1]
MPLSELQQLKWIYDLYQLGHSDLSQGSSNKVYGQILRHIVEGLRANTGSLVLYQGENSNQLTIVAGFGLPEGCIGSVIPNGTGVIGWVLENKQAILLKGNIDNDPRFHDPIPKADNQIPHSSLCWPLLVGNRLLGAICVNNLDDNEGFSEVHLERGQLLVNLVTLVIDNIWLIGDKLNRIQLLAASNERYIKLNQELQETHNRLEQSEKRLTDILDSLDSVVWSMKPKTLEMLYLNKAVEEVSGHAVADFFNNPNLWLDIIHPRDRDRVKSSMVDLLTLGVQKITCRILRPDGELRWLFHHMRAINDGVGTPLRIDGITVDITQHKNAEDLLKQRNEELQEAFDKIKEVQGQLVQSEKLSSIGQLAAGVAHEINNPIGYINSNLTSLKNYVEDLLALAAIYEQAEPTLADTEQLRQIEAFKHKIDLEFLKTDVLDLLDESHEGASRVKKIVQDLKDFSHAGGDDDWQWADLHTGLESTLNIVNNEIKYKASVIKEFGDIPQAWCLPHQLNQVFMNLLVNAAHAIENEGSITVRTGEGNDHIWVEVSDTGKGIAPEHVNKIFDPFFTTKPVGKGTGLGLSVSYNIIKKHNGEIQLDSRVGEGTTFRIVLPKKDETATTE